MWVIPSGVEGLEGESKCLDSLSQLMRGKEIIQECG